VRGSLQKLANPPFHAFPVPGFQALCDFRHNRIGLLNQAIFGFSRNYRTPRENEENY
jgi:hypothetical protein